MTIVVDSSQWTGEYDDRRLTGPIVWGAFPDRAALDQAAARVREEAWFGEANPEVGEGDPGRADNEQVITPDTDPVGADRRNLRQNLVGTAMASTSM
ncbi:MAG TPA: hypothetical protein VE684_12680, partial [Crenalkalicoccus sp.]|nr:hypothetical protein [Crenalkalicoccus sp.]